MEVIYRLGNKRARAEVSTVGLGSSITGCAVVVATVVEGLGVRDAPNRLALMRRPVATVVASVVGAAVVVVVVVVVARTLVLPKRRLVVGSRLGEPDRTELRCQSMSKLSPQK